MKRDLDVYLERREPAWSHEVGWQSRQVCTIPLCKDGAWYAGPLHVNEGPAMPGDARTLRYALHAGRSGEGWFESLSVMVFSEAGELLKQLSLPGHFMQDKPCELDVRSLHLPLQSRLRLLFKTPVGKDPAGRARERQVESWMALAA